MAFPFKRLGVYLDLVYVFPVSVLGGSALGYFIDHWLGTTPYGVLIGFVLGMAGAFWYLFRMLNTLKRNGDDGDR